MPYNWYFGNADLVYESAFLVSGRHPDIKIVVIESAISELSAKEVVTLWPEGFLGFALECAALIEAALWMHHQPEDIRIEWMKEDHILRHPSYGMLLIDASMTAAADRWHNHSQQLPRREAANAQAC